jgi:hypothetical protein
VISELGFAVLVWGSLAIVAVVFGYLLLTTLQGVVRARRDQQSGQPGVGR